MSLIFKIYQLENFNCFEIWSPDFIALLRPSLPLILLIVKPFHPNKFRMERDGEATFKHTAIKKSVVLSVTYHRFTSICRLKFKYIISSSEVNQTNNVPFFFVILLFYSVSSLNPSPPPPPHKTHNIQHRNQTIQKDSGRRTDTKQSKKKNKLRQGFVGFFQDVAINSMC